MGWAKQNEINFTKENGFLVDFEHVESKKLEKLSEKYCYTEFKSKNILLWREFLCSKKLVSGKYIVIARIIVIVRIVIARSDCTYLLSGRYWEKLWKITSSFVPSLTCQYDLRLLLPLPEL